MKNTKLFLTLLLAALACPPATIQAMDAQEQPAAVAEILPDSPPASPIAQIGDYAALEYILADYKTLAASGGWPSFKGTDKKIELGAQDARIPTIRTILSIMGDYTGTASHSTTYDSALENAVKIFQERHGLNNDGVIGKGTLAALNTPIEKRIAQIENSIKRMRELPTDLGERFIFVNLPDFRLRGFDGGHLAIDMKVIVGAPKTRTPTFHNEISYVSFNPHWGVPARIAKTELLPKIAANPDYVKIHNYAIYNMSNDVRVEVNPDTIDWDSLGKRNFPYQLRQRPGKGNALGKIKFGMENSDSIYLHDTAKPSLFSKEERALSHGCIRVERPYELAQFVFQRMENFDSEKVDSLYKNDASKIVKTSPLPVHIVYWTAWVDAASGKPQFRKDMYNLDKSRM